MPTIIQGAPVPGPDGPEDQTFIAPPQEFQPEAGAGGPAAQVAGPVPGQAPADQPPADVPAPEGHPPQPVQPARPGFRERGRLRRRLRYLREVRELGYRDLGGLVFDQHRFQRPNGELVEDKVEAIDAIDIEMRAIEHALDTSAPYTELFIPGLSACPRCGALHESEANFCPHCGLAFRGPRTVAGVGVGADGGAVPLPGAQYPPPPGAMAPPAPAAYAPPAYAPAPQPAAYPPAPQPATYPPAPQPHAPAAEPAPEPPQDTQVQPAPPSPDAQ